MAKKYRGKSTCCTCFYNFIRKDENSDPCDICFGNLQYSETNIQCHECYDKDCKYREAEYKNR